MYQWRPLLGVMFSQIDDYLNEDEVLEVSISPSPLDTRYLKWHVVAVAVFVVHAWLVVVQPENVMASLPDGVGQTELLAGFAVPVLLFATTEVRRKLWRYHITDQRIVKEVGLLNRRFLEVNFRKVTETRLREPFHKQVFGIGDLMVSTAGTDAIELKMHGVPDPKHYKVKIGSKSSVAHMPHDVPSDHQAVSAEALEAELDRIQQRREDLERSWADQAIAHAEYERRWYLLEGEERLVQHLLNRIGEDVEDEEVA